MPAAANARPLESAPTTTGHWIAMTDDGPAPFTVFMGTDTDTGYPCLRWVWGAFADEIDMAWTAVVGGPHGGADTDELWGSWSCIKVGELAPEELAALAKAWATNFRAGAIDVEALLVPFADIRRGVQMESVKQFHGGAETRTPVTVVRVTKTLIVVAGGERPEERYLRATGHLKDGTCYHNPGLQRIAA